VCPRALHHGADGRWSDSAGGWTALIVNKIRVKRTAGKTRTTQTREKSS